MPLTVLHLSEKPPRYTGRRGVPMPFRLDTAQVPVGLWPGRGLLYAFLVHEIVLLSFVVLPSFAEPRKPKNNLDQAVVLDLNSPEALFYFPELNKISEARKETPKGKPAAAPAEKANTERARTEGRSYPGPQEIVSDVPNATNRFQSLLQPMLQNPPIVQPPIPLPNMIQMADAGPPP